MTDKSMFDLSGRVALVTGGGFGIGRSICDALAEFGAHVVVADLNEEIAKETAQLISRFGHRTMVIKADVSNGVEVQNVVDKTVASFGTIDIAVNNAGAIMGRFKIHETPEEIWDRTMAINLKSVFLCCKAEIPIMLKKKKGSIINTASVGGILPGDPDMLGSIYDTAKAGIIAFSRKAAGEYGRDGIRINAIAPGMISGTAFGAERKKNAPPNAAQKLQERIDKMALGRPGTADELKGIVVYLASDAASYATGQVFVIDGGIS
jgi:NAD(P)-dependent dehydrogenase (short-subunit alcohol dehydrogenase family)